MGANFDATTHARTRRFGKERVAGIAPLLTFNHRKNRRQLPGLNSHRARESTTHESGSTRHIYGAQLHSIIYATHVTSRVVGQSKFENFGRFNGSQSQIAGVRETAVSQA